MGEAGLVSRAVAWVRWYAVLFVLLLGLPVWVISGAVTGSGLSLAAGVLCGLMATAELILCARREPGRLRAPFVRRPDSQRFPLQAASLASGLAIGAALVSESTRTGRADLVSGIAFVVASIGAIGECLSGR
ncbi:hypothetical protein SAMN02745716_0735 [Thermoleophilum album]|uniref:Uncharacterized protein n=1 Tax=Thermoleophilum album TaxID=29539 RepID=A0A1H6FKF4_THEAL|nr:hypothetical protein SAMN02745716_0735 [Thermoleophilum album]